MSVRRLAILGATGSIGVSAQKVARRLPDRVRLVGLSSRQNMDALASAAVEFRPSIVCAGTGESAQALAGKVGDAEIVSGEDGLIAVATHPEVDMVLVAIVGTAGLRPALAAIEAGKDLAVASKEILVMAGEIIMAAAARKGVRVLPVDSEHNAIFQCLNGAESRSVRRLILTCSGGPFRTASVDDLAHVTQQMALRHPTWQMGPKISIDSATLFNKGLEVIEARWLFGFPVSQIDVIVHPQSIVHSLVEFVDRSVLCQMSVSDMCFPIQYAVTFPDRVEGMLRELDLATVGKLEFEPPRRDVFPALDLADEACGCGGTLPAVLNAANEVAVEAFLQERLPFVHIWKLVERTMAETSFEAGPSLGGILAADAEARVRAAAFVRG